MHAIIIKSCDLLERRGVKFRLYALCFAVVVPI